MKDFQKSFKFQKWEGSDAAQREHGDGAETIPSTGRSTNREQNSPKNSNNCKNKLLTLRFQPGEFPPGPSSGPSYCPDPLQASGCTFTWGFSNLQNPQNSSLLLLNTSPNPSGSPFQKRNHHYFIRKSNMQPLFSHSLSCFHSLRKLFNLKSQSDKCCKDSSKKKVT